MWLPTAEGSGGSRSVAVGMGCLGFRFVEFVNWLGQAVAK